MPLAAGARLGAYEIIAPIGSGGMGEVYRARDTRLDRDVAIKVLPAHLANDEAARSRFEREAKAIAALSHPNILAIYDVGAVDDVTDGGPSRTASGERSRTAFVVMELLEGETLRQRLTNQAALPARKAIQIAIDIALGLAAAHDKQIVHRDIKPANVFLASDGRVKILDFGLAKAAGPTEASPGATEAKADAPTQLQQTDPGTVMGTVGYMAPEQVRGQPVDQRADIFSLGCVLYEMASGRRPFARESAAETISAILRDEPPDLTRGGGAIPASLDSIIRHCLEKRPEERFQSARDLAFALQSLGTNSAAIETPAAAPASAWRPSFGLSVVVVGSLIGAFAAGRAWGVRSGAATSGSQGPRVERVQQVTDVAGVERQPTLSPDGKTVVYVSAATGKNQIYAQRIGSRTSTVLTSGEANYNPAFSPDGERVAFRSDREGGGIFLMSASGESVTRVSDEGFSPSWSPDGRELVVAPGTFVSPTDVASTAPGLTVIDIKAGTRRAIVRTGTDLQPAWSPHGYRVAYFSVRAGTGQRDVFTVAADGSTPEAPVDVTNDAPIDWNPVWSPAGDYLYFSSNRGGTMNLWRVPIDERTGHARAEPEPVTTPSNWSGMMSFSHDGLSMAFASLDWRSTLLRQNFDPAREVTVGAPTPLLRGSRPIRDHDVSPDGQWIAFNETAAREDLFVARVDGSEYRRLTDDAARDRGPVWTRDGQRIVFYSDRGGTYDVWSIHRDGSHLEPLTSGTGANFPTISPDGARMAYSNITASGFTIVPFAPGAPAITNPAPEPKTADGLVYWPSSWSASGQVLGAGLTPQGTVAGLLVYDVAARTYRPAGDAEDAAWGWQTWLRDGRRFLIRGPSGISIASTATGARRLLTATRGYFFGKSLCVSPDNTWYSYTETGTEGDVWVAVMKGK